MVSGGRPIETPVVYPNPSRDDQPIHVVFQLNKGADRVVVSVVTDDFRLVYKKVSLGPFWTGRNTLVLPREGLHLANGLYYVIVTLPSGEKAVGKMVMAD